MDDTAAKESKELIDELKQQSAALQATKEEENDESKNNGKSEGGSRVYTDPNDGTQYEWDENKRAWFPKVISFCKKYNLI